MWSIIKYCDVQVEKCTNFWNIALRSFNIVSGEEKHSDLCSAINNADNVSHRLIVTSDDSFVLHDDWDLFHFFNFLLVFHNEGVFIMYEQFQQSKKETKTPYTLNLGISQ